MITNKFCTYTSVPILLTLQFLHCQYHTLHTLLYVSFFCRLVQRPPNVAVYGAHIVIHFSLDLIQNPRVKQIDMLHAGDFGEMDMDDLRKTVSKSKDADANLMQKSEVFISI